MDCCLFIDGYSLAFRAFYALPQTLSDSSGQPTNALHGFTRMLANLVSRYEPTHMAVAFDFPGATFRESLYNDYKAQRSATPESLRPQLQILRPLVESLSIPSIEVEGYEADDILGALGVQAKQRKIKAFIVTGDRDSYQLVEDPFVAVLYNRRGVSEIDLMDEAAVEAKAGVPPRLYSDFAALRGDPSDNIPGTPGIGEKTAAKLILEYGSIDSLLDHVSSLPTKQRDSISANSQQLRTNSQLSKIEVNVPLGVDFEQLEITEWDSSRAAEIFGAMDLRGSLNSLRKSFAYRRDTAPRGGDASRAAQELLKPVSLTGWDDGVPAPKEGTLSLTARFAGTPGRSPLLALAVSHASKGTLFTGPWTSDAEIAGRAFGDSPAKLSVRGVALKELLRSMSIEPDSLPKVDIDLSLAEYLLDPGSGELSLAALTSKYLDNGEDSPRDLQSGLFEVDERDIAEALGSELAAIDQLAPLLEKRLEERGLTELYWQIEAPLVRVLAKMEITGIAVDRDALQSINRSLALEVASLLVEIRNLVGTDLNPNSTQQLAQILFKQLGLTPGKRTKTGFSTDAQTLEKLRGAHPVVDLVLRYRELDKLRSTFAEGLLGEIADDGRIHATFHQTVARTGRISSESPNLHNIPIRSEEGKRFREVFVAPPGCQLIVADYSQIELRVIAHLSQDPNLIEAMAGNRDVHTQTAALVFGVEPAEVTSAQRSKAKMVAYGLAYGMEAYGLSQRLGISTPEADEILRSFFQAFPSVRQYMDSTIDEARRTGYTRTLFGRRRYFSDLASPNRSLRLASERQAMNAGIQGLAADIFKIALVKLDEEIQDLPARVVLQVHDEVVVEVEESASEEIVRVVRDTLANAATLSVPLAVNISVGKSWAEAK